MNVNTLMSKLGPDGVRLEEHRVMALLHIGFLDDYDGGDTVHRHEAPRAMSSIPHPKRELLRLCARIGYTPH